MEIRSAMRSWLSKAAGIWQSRDRRGAGLFDDAPLPHGRGSDRTLFRTMTVWRAAFVFCMVVSSTVLGQKETTESAAVTTAVGGGWLEAILFYFLAGGAVLSGLGVCVSQNIVRMATWLFLTLSMVSMLYFLLAANFLGVIQLIVYAGGTLVLLIFGVMLTSKSPWARFECGAGELVGAAAVCGLLLGCLVAVLTAVSWNTVQAAVPGTSVADIGRRLLTQYLVPFEVAGVLLFVVMVGAAHLARQQEE